MSYKSKKIKVLDPEEGYNLYAPYYQNDFKFLESFEKGKLLEMFPRELKGKKVLDIGCGSGRIIQQLTDRGAEITACDISDKMLEITANKFKNVKTQKADIENLPFADSSFDFVVALFVIVHLPELNKAFSEVYRVLKPGGFFILNNVNQRREPTLKIPGNDGIKIKSYFHRQENVLKALEYEFFQLLKQEIIFEDKIWINQIIKTQKSK